MAKIATPHAVDSPRGRNGVHTVLGAGMLTPRKQTAPSGLPTHTVGFLDQNTPTDAANGTTIRELHKIPHHGHTRRWQNN